MKNDAPTNPSRLDAARAELARLEQRRDADMARYAGMAQHRSVEGGLEDSPRRRHLDKRRDTHQALITRAQEVVLGLEFDVTVAAALATAKAAAQEADDAARAAVKARAADVQRETAALEQVTARATALEGQIAELEASRFAGLDQAQAALTQRTVAGDEAGAKTAAEAVARIEATAAAVTAQLRPLQLQLAEVGKLKEAAETRVQQAKAAAAGADNALSEAFIEVLALDRDEAVLALRGPLRAFVRFCGTRRRDKTLPPDEFFIGASHLLLKALGKRADEKLCVSGVYPGCVHKHDEFINESIFNQDPLKLEDAAAMIARKAAERTAVQYV